MIFTASLSDTDIALPNPENEKRAVKENGTVASLVSDYSLDRRDKEEAHFSLLVDSFNLRICSEQRHACANTRLNQLALWIFERSAANVSHRHTY